MFEWIGAVVGAVVKVVEDVAGAVEVDLLPDRRNAIRTQIEAISRRNTDSNALQELGIEELARKVVRGAFRLKRLKNDPHAQKTIILATFSEIFVKDLSIIAFRFREDFGPGARNECGVGFATPPIHLETPFTLPSTDPLPEGMRRCSCCREVFPAAEFPYPKKRHCRKCISEKAHAAYLRRSGVSGNRHQ